MEKILLAGGVTGGHLIPALSMVKEIHNIFKNSSIIIHTSSVGFEDDFLKNETITYHKIKGIRTERRVSINNLTLIFFVLIEILRMFGSMRKEKPRFVIGTGGFVSIPIYVISILLKIPFFIIEPNVKIGLVNSLFVKKSIATFRFLGNYISDEYRIGIPLRSDFINKHFEFIRVNLALPRILILGGSLGSNNINEEILILLKKGSLSNYDVVWQTGKTHWGKYSNYNGHRITITPFIDNICDAYNNADIIISSAGAGIIAEVAVVGRPLILIPMKPSTGNHQKYNAEYLLEINAARIANCDSLGLSLIENIESLVSNYQERLRISKNIQRLSFPHASRNIIKRIKQELNEM